MLGGNYENLTQNLVMTPGKSKVNAQYTETASDDLSQDMHCYCNTN